MCYNLPVLILLIQLSSLELIFSSEYTRPNKYFINCGSKSNTNSSNGRTFIGDLNPSLPFSTGNSETVEDKNPSPKTPPLYNTARVYKRRDSYELEVEKAGTYILRLHFFPFSSPSINLSDAVFNVSASGYSLLSNFGLKNGSSTWQVEEFLVPVSEGTFSLYFVPSRDSSFAFVNAIEVFPAPDRFVPSSASRVASSGRNDTFTGVSALVLRTVHRINVGGAKVTPENDTLWRTWKEDYAFLLGSKFMSIGEERLNGGELVYNPKRATKYTAPDYVYNTARFLSSALNFSKMGWNFRVSEEVSHHLVRLHFCDVVSQAVESYNFSLSIYNGFRTSIDPYGETRNIASPFYFDFVVDSKGSRSINVSIELEPQNAQNPIAFLNGLEIFEMWNISGLVPPLRPKKKHEQGILIGFVVGSIVACVILVGLLIIAFLFYKKRTRKSRTSRFSLGVFVSGGTSSSGKSSGFPSSLNLSLKIPFAVIEKATKNFDEDLLLGEGGFGRVYRGLLKGTKVAVKRGRPRSGQGVEEFQTEIMVLSRIRHRRLLSLIGYCDEMSEMILVYEFMEKGTLREHLHGSSSSGGLSWEKRLEICIGAAEGLEYLHTGLPEVVLHHDVKSTNILLDERFAAKVADFGLSMLGTFDPDDEQLAFVKGSFGYFDPEYTTSSIYTEQSDVYSFGVVLLEVLCARPAILEDNVNLAKWAMDRKRNGTIKEIVDRSLVGEIEGSSLRVFVDIAEKCLRERGVDRPSMKDVVYYLKYALTLHRGTTCGEPFDEDTATNLAFPYSFAGLREEEDKSLMAVHLNYVL